MGATATAIANTQALTRRHGPAPQAFVVVPIVGAFFIDLMNLAVLTFFLLPGFVVPLRSADAGAHQSFNGRKSLNVSAYASHIVGWPVEQGRALLRELTEFATQQKLVYRHVWRAGDLVV